MIGFHFHSPVRIRVFACAACQRDMKVLAPKFFGISTLTCLCLTCAQALTRKWPDVFEKPAEATP